MEEIKKIRAFKCNTCLDWDDIEKQCRSNVLIDKSKVDSFGDVICSEHKNKQSGKPTGGYKELKERQKVWFTSDFHFGHATILHFYPERRKHCGITDEDFFADKNAATDKMDEFLIKQWNNTVKKQDTVYFLGDFCLKNKEYTEKILQKLHGKKFLIIGNHDKSLKGLERYFEDVSQIKEVKFTNNQFPFIDAKETFSVEMCHYPLLTWQRRNNGSCMVHGHSHSSCDEINTISKELRVDVGIDSKLANYNLIEIETLYTYFKNVIQKEGCKTFEEYIVKLINGGIVRNF